VFITRVRFPEVLTNLSAYGRRFFRYARTRQIVNDGISGVSLIAWSSCYQQFGRVIRVRFFVFALSYRGNSSRGTNDDCGVRLVEQTTIASAEIHVRLRWKCRNSLEPGLTDCSRPSYRTRTGHHRIGVENGGYVSH